MLTLPPALAPMAAYPSWICWIARPSQTKPGKLEKFPIHHQTGHFVDAHDPANWTNPETAMVRAPGFNQGWGSGAGFVFTDADDFFFLDIDGCFVNDQWTPLAQELIARLPGAACEVSASGRGLHLFGRTGPLEHGTRNIPLGLELYTRKRFVALTGSHARGDAGQDCTAALAAIVTQYFPPTALARGEHGDWTTEPVDGYGGPEDDDDLIARAIAGGQRNAAAAFGGDQGVTFADLWTANEEPLGKRWPDATRPFSPSEADQALANHLAFWTGKNCERMERLMRRSALVREKWDTHHTYLELTIKNACAFVQKVAEGRKSSAGAALPPVDREELVEVARSAGREVRPINAEYMNPAQQLDHFDGCFFLSESAKVFDLTRNAIVGKGSFDVLKGGHLFVMDPLGQKTTGSAWDAFTLSRVNVPQIVDDLCFRPEIESGAVIRDGHRTLVNSYVAYDPPTTEGDPAPFLTVLEKSYPDERDRQILLHYFACLVQHPGRKLQWWPVLQGAEGTGKTMIIETLRFAIGPHYSHTPNAAKIAKHGIQFNAWLSRKLFLALEEVHFSNRRDFLEEFKAIVTNTTSTLEKKGVDETTTDNRANGILATNHRDGVPITVDTRRYAVFFSVLQDAAAIQAAGLTNDFWGDFWDWFRGHGVYAHQGAMYGARVLANYLQTFPMAAEFDPTREMAARAPRTSSTAEAVTASLGQIEQEILDAIEEGQPGFAGGWVSSKYLDLLIDRKRVNVQRNKRREMMQRLGYDWHPALRDGRVNDVVMPDAGKPKLYVRAGHLALNLTTPVEVARAYSKAQDATSSDAARAFS